jgi:hypothetical protein
MRTITVKDKHLKLDQSKIERAKQILKARTETEAIEKALALVIATDTRAVQRGNIIKEILTRRDRLKIVSGDVADWVHEGRRDKTYGG